MCECELDAGKALRALDHVRAGLESLDGKQGRVPLRAWAEANERRMKAVMARTFGVDGNGEDR